MPRIKHKSQHLGAFTSNGVKCLNPDITTHIQKTPFFILSKLPTKLFFMILEWIATKSHHTSNSDYGPKIHLKIR